MASGDWAASNVSSSSSYTLTAPVTYYASGGITMPAPRPQTALEWLDAEIEAVCKLARLAG